MSDEPGAIAFAERVLELLDEGRYTATYKYAVLLALMDLCLERTRTSGAPPEMFTTQELAEKIVEIYWPHTVPFGRQALETQVLRQNTGGQAEIVSAISRFRSRYAPEAASCWQGRVAAPKRYAALVRTVEWKLIEMPLPRLQRMGRASVNFIYEIGWNERIARSAVDGYARGDAGEFDNRVLLKPGVGAHLLQLNGLLRPLIHRRWCAMVALLNKLEDSRLEDFLFGERVPTTQVRAGLWEIQGRQCFYCGQRVMSPDTAHVDHFIPWARYPDNGIENLVVADVACNGDKGSSLAAGEHVARWAGRLSPSGGPVDQQRSSPSSRRGPAGSTMRRARSRSREASTIYLGLPVSARLWLLRKDFVPVDHTMVRRALGVLA